MSKKAASGKLLGLYRLVTRAATPLAGMLVAWRTRRGKEDPTRRNERFGFASVDRPKGPLLWAHAASVGESVSILPLIRKLHDTFPHLNILVTTTTLTSARFVQRNLPERAIHQFVPIDMPVFVNRFLGHWRPELIFFAESELWPNMLTTAARAGAQMALVNARMSQRSFSRWQYFPQTIRSLLSCFKVCLTQSPGDADRLRDLGAPHVMHTGNIKFDVPAPPADPSELALFRAAFAARPRWAAVSTHPGEEDIVEEAHVELARTRNRLVTIIAPRHPERGPEIANMLSARGHTVQLRSQQRQPQRDSAFYIFDTIGELGFVFRTVPACFMGGSMVRHGGQNPIEPTKLGCAVVHGPHVGNFTEVYGALDLGGGAENVRGSIQLAQAMGQLIDNRQKAQLRANAAQAALAPYSGALDATLAALEPLLSAALMPNRQKPPTA
ncbi:MAG: 3-deoxy-D-manno-octulosonic acid transferase [Rhodobiaceae bacterium]|nr:3-deoxy-D-manno-octulosonic acid transferase [Rhodobiaceae bacterium]MCC0018124.1 3-deoxy-D-manno-octulosonic acid transferase [Rhodobiaceae bacterium]MCC0050610.1 3-deoxy-D-manno-octulosonic acid transferase [Rhodobiaceae bacterium]MCC0059813.1 3-deoxy-D-manno-octulosonic acid transferase [Rhodobiaceae bacterium]